MRKPAKTLVSATLALAMALATTPLAPIASLATESEPAKQAATDQTKEQGEKTAPAEVGVATATETATVPSPIATQSVATTHSTSATQNGVTFTVTWDDAPAGEATTFHVTQTGGSSEARARMDAPTYWDTDNSQESVCDPSRDAWGSYYTLGTDGYDFTFNLTASGTYRINFYFMDETSGVWYLRTTASIAVNDSSRPSVTQIVNSAVTQCRQETDGSEYAMALWLHDWALDQLEYDHSLNYCSAESGLTRGLGTCESYQRIYAKLLNTAGIANGRIEGNGHAWNAAKIDGKWCQMDLTWDDTSNNWYGDLDQRHLYFGLTDELMAIAHSDHSKNYQADDYAYRSEDLSNNYFVRNGKASEWAEKYADRIQQHLDAHETEFSIDADNQSFPPSISGIQNAIVTYAMNRREWSVGSEAVTLTATSNVTTVSNYQWTAKYNFEAKYPGESTPMTDISRAWISVPNVEYTGTTLEPTTIVLLNDVCLEQGKDYTAIYFDNVTPGLAEIVISGIGNYTGTVRKTFEIMAPSTAVKFVANLYAGGTNRRADADGFAYWLSVTEELGYENAAAYFLSSSEVINRAQTDEALVIAVYHALLSREPDSSERTCWITSLERGTMPSDFARTITSSYEFALEHPSVSIEEFVENMYKEGLGRYSDREGFTYWTSVIVDQASAQNAIEATFASNEFNLKDLGPEETVRRIYRSALLRNPDMDGLKYYSGLIEKGATSLDIVKQVTSSQEFKMVCAKCGLS